MNFDFYDQFKGYSNTELLKIIQRPNEYQVDAVNAATKILSEREISQADIEKVKNYYSEIDNNAKLKVDKINSYKNKAAEFLEPVINPGTEVKPARWLNILLVIIGLQYLWTLFINIGDISRFIKFIINCKESGFDNPSKHPINYWTCFTNQFNIIIFFELLTLIYVPIIFYLLYKRKCWGWVLLFADNLFGLISTISQSYPFFKHQQFHHGDTVSFFTQILIKGLFIFFLWRNYIADFFGVTTETKKKTAFITLGIIVAFILGIQLFI